MQHLLYQDAATTRLLISAALLFGKMGKTSRGAGCGDLHRRSLPLANRASYAGTEGDIVCRL